MNAEVEENTATGRRRVHRRRCGRPPSSRGLVQVDALNVAEKPTRKEVLRKTRNWKEAEVVPDREHHSAFGGRGEHRIAFRCGPSHRLLDEHVNASSQEIGGDPSMQVVWNSDDGGIDPARKLFVALEYEWLPEATRYLRGALGLGVADRNEVDEG